MDEVSRPPSDRAAWMDRFRLDGKVALVTGASGGLGAGLARALAEAGADLVLAARRVPGLTATAAAVREHGRRALVVPTDVTNPEQCTNAVAAAMHDFGRLDVLVNNAGVQYAVPALREPPDSFRAAIDVNLLGAYWMAQACGRVMQPGSSIVNMASALALMKSLFPHAAYASSKAGLVALTRDLAQQWSGRQGIRVNAVAPGVFPSEMSGPEVQDSMDRVVAATCPMGRVGRQHELDAAVVFLASDAASYITGVTLAVDGGMTCH